MYRFLNFLLMGWNIYEDYHQMVPGIFPEIFIGIVHRTLESYTGYSIKRSSRIRNRGMDFFTNNLKLSFLPASQSFLFCLTTNSVISWIFPYHFVKKVLQLFSVVEKITISCLGYAFKKCYSLLKYCSICVKSN